MSDFRLLSIVPCTITIGAFLCGLSSIRASFEQQFDTAFVYIFVAAILDGCDGHVARALSASSAIGFELDSLCDLVNFGVCPAMMMYNWASTAPSTASSSASGLWAAALFYAVCCVTRLARFNVYTTTPQAKSHTSPVHVWRLYLAKEKFFSGVPAPMGAVLAVSPLALDRARESPHLHALLQPALAYISISNQTLQTAVFLLVGALMVSNIKSFSSKMLFKKPVDPRDPRTSHFRSRSTCTLLLKLLLVAAAAWLLFNYTWHVWLALIAVYVGSLPISHATYLYLFPAASAGI